jgi:hypothetical protein
MVDVFRHPVRRVLSGGQSFEPSRKSRPMFVFHSDELHAHTLFGATSLDSGTSTYLTCRRINKQLNEGSSRRRIRCTDEQSAQAEVVHYRNRSFVESMPSDDRPFRGGKARINATFAILVRHGDLAALL